MTEPPTTPDEAAVFTDRLECPVCEKPCESFPPLPPDEPEPGSPEELEEHYPFPHWIDGTTGTCQCGAELVVYADGENACLQEPYAEDRWRHSVDTALARIAALEAEAAVETVGEAMRRAEASRDEWRQMFEGMRDSCNRVTEQRDAALARVAELEAAAAPKPRDESMPPPGWMLEPDRFDDEDEPYVTRGSLCSTLSNAWRLYDEEHGYAPDLKTARADERAKTERDIVAHFIAKRGDTTDDILDDIKRSDYPRTEG